MKDTDELREQIIAIEKGIETLHNFPPCPKHGRQYLRICDECLEEISCTECDPVPCQCWNDE